MNRKQRITIGSLSAEAVVLILLIYTAIPLIWTFILSVKTTKEIYSSPLSMPATWMWENYVKAYKTMKPLNLIKNTLIDEFASLAITLVVCTMASFGISRMKTGTGRLQSATYVFFIAGTIVPAFVIIIPLYMWFAKFGIVDTLWALILPHAAWTIPMNIMLLVGAFNNIPKEMDEAAVIDGCGTWRILTNVNFPLVMPTIITIIIIQFIYIWNDFFLSLVMITSVENRTIALASSVFKGTYSSDYALMSAGIIILILPLIILFVFLQKYVVDGVTTGAVKG